MSNHEDVTVPTLAIPHPSTTIPAPVGGLISVPVTFDSASEALRVICEDAKYGSAEGRTVKAILRAVVDGLRNVKRHEDAPISSFEVTIANQARRIDLLETGHRHWRGQCRILKLKVAEYERGISRRGDALREDDKKWDELQNYLSKASGGSVPSTNTPHGTMAVGLHNVREIVERVINGSPDNPRLAIDPDADMFESEVRKLIHSRMGANNVNSEQCKAIASALRTAGFVRLRQ